MNNPISTVLSATPKPAAASSEPARKAPTDGEDFKTVLEGRERPSRSEETVQDAPETQEADPQEAAEVDPESAPSEGEPDNENMDLGSDAPPEMAVAPTRVRRADDGPDLTTAKAPRESDPKPAPQTTPQTQDAEAELQSVKRPQASSAETASLLKMAAGSAPQSSESRPTRSAPVMSVPVPVKIPANAAETVTVDSLRTGTASAALVAGRPVPQNLQQGAMQPSDAPLEELPLDEDLLQPRKSAMTDPGLRQITRTGANPGPTATILTRNTPVADVPMAFADSAKVLSAVEAAAGSDDLGLARAGGLTSQAAQVTTAYALAGPATARHVASQMAIAILQTNGGPTELSLNPPELGKVRLRLTAQDTSIVLMVQADRPETSDMMRRHIDVLAQEFRTLGYGNIRFEFGGGNGAQPDADRQGGDAPSSEREDIPLQTSDIETVQQQAALRGGLDLRL